jgi:hypothetical protein
LRIPAFHFFCYYHNESRECLVDKSALQSVAPDLRELEKEGAALPGHRISEVNPFLVELKGFC